MVEKYLNRTSVRDFDKKPLSDQDLKIIKDVINASPTSTNANQFSAIIVTDQKSKDLISQWNYGQQHIKDAAAFIVFVADSTRTLEAVKKSGVSQTEELVKNNFQRAIVDGTIAATYVHDALIEMGYGTTFVGGITSYGDAVSSILDIPDTAFPFLGLSFGKATKENPVKPKMDKVFVNKYDEEKSKQEFWDYNKRTNEYFLSRREHDYYEQIASQSDETSFYGKAFGTAGKFYEDKLKKLIEKHNIKK